MGVLAKHIICGFAKHAGVVVGTIFCLQFVLWEPPAFTGTFQDVQKKGEKAAKDTQKAGKKAAKGIEKAPGKALQGTQKAGGKALQDVQKAGGKALQIPGKSLQSAFKGKKRGSGNSPKDPDSSDGGAELGQGSEAGFNPGFSDPALSGQGAGGGFNPGFSDPALSGQGSAYFPNDPYYPNQPMPNQPMGDPKRGPEFSLGSTEPSLQGDDKSVYDKLGISGLALPEGATERENPETAIPQGEEGEKMPEKQGR